MAIRDELDRELGGAPCELAGLGDAELAALLEDVRGARRRQHEAVATAIDQAMAMVPLVLRGALRRILFP